MGEWMETRLFPRKLGADAVNVRGLAARCDLVIVSDRADPPVRVMGDAATASTVFVSLRHPEPALQCLLHDVVPSLRGEFIIISGSADLTFPDQIDARFPAYPPDLMVQIEALLGDPRLVHWYAENLARPATPKLSPIPLGFVFETDAQRDAFVLDTGPDLSKRALKVLCAHRSRPGPQWQARHTVSALAAGPWARWTTTPDQELDPKAFDAALHAHAFVLCVEGGGLDPAPKAFLALSRGAIPIIRRSALSMAYGQLPCVMVDDWVEDAITAEKLDAWRDEFAPVFERGAYREGLTLDYWWRQIRSGAPIFSA